MGGLGGLKSSCIKNLKKKNPCKLQQTEKWCNKSWKHRRKKYTQQCQNKAMKKQMKFNFEMAICNIQNYNEIIQN